MSMDMRERDRERESGSTTWGDEIYTAEKHTKCAEEIFQKRDVLGVWYYT